MLTLFPVFVGITADTSVQEGWKRTLVSTVLDILPQIMDLTRPPWLLSIIKKPDYFKLGVFISSVEGD